MTSPGVRITKLDGALGVQPPSAGRMPAYVGASTAGPLNMPATFSRVKDITAAFGTGPLVEAAAAFVDRWSRPVTLVRSDSDPATTPLSSITKVGTGTSVVTIDGSPPDDYDLVLWFPVGGTVGTPGIQYRLSWDGGINFDKAAPLGSATAITGNGVTFHLATGTVVSGDTHTLHATAPQWSDSDLGAAIDVLGRSRIAWELLNVVGPMAPSTFDLVDTKITALEEAGKPRGWIGHVRMPNPGETHAEYQTALTSPWANKATLTGSLCAGDGQLISGVSGRSYRRPLSYAYGALTGGVSEEVNVADVGVGQLKGFSITDANGNPIAHDESLYPGLDDLRFVTAKTWGDAYEGVYINRPRIFAPSGSDFQIMPRVRVMAIARVALNAYFIRRLNKSILVNESTGFILETEALEIEAGARAAMAGPLLGGARKASAVQFKLSRTDPVLSNLTLTGDARVIGLAYPEQVNITLGYYNPALRIQQVAA